ncbi:MAG TPA: hypothetical protein VFK32_07050, partial [Tepidiformaceae bacterium]|nr:hypothetical protein [Tepidiformaceae bacterium]
MPNSLDLDGATPVGDREGETDSGASGRVIVARGRPPIAPTTRRHIIGPRPFVVAAATLDLETPY